VNKERINKPKRPQIFVSYAGEDRAIARQVSDSLQSAGLLVWNDAWELAPGDSVVQRIQEALSSSDILLVLLSRSSVASHWVQSELSAALSMELRDRAITVIPALIEDCDIPPLLSDRVFIDLRGDLGPALQRLVRQIGSAPDLDFSKLDPHAYESLISALLSKLGFIVLSPPTTLPESYYDFVATYRTRDHFGAEQTDIWLVELKLYRDQRVSVSSLREMSEFLKTTGHNKRILVITNSRLTSVARNLVLEITEKSAHRLRVIDGTELTNLLIQYPDLIRTYFPSGQLYE